MTNNIVQTDIQLPTTYPSISYGSSNFSDDPDIDKKNTLTECVALENPKILDINTIPKGIKQMEYAVRGAILTHAARIEAELKKPSHEYSYDSLIYVNIGNPQAVGQVPFTFVRQVIACLLYPPLAFPPKDKFFTIEEAVYPVRYESSGSIFPRDVQERARTYLKAFSQIGAYSSSQGVPKFREIIANWISNRDGYKCSSDSIFLTDGATSGIKSIMELLITSKRDGLLLPIPQYPLYSAILTKLEGVACPYYLQEKNNWQLSVEDLEDAYNKATADDVRIKAVVVINPNNPTGAVIDDSELEGIIRFCEKHHLLIIADEVYQSTIYTSESNVFTSFRKLYREMQASVELVSLHSVSKSLGECGLRGGFMQLENFDPEIVDIIIKCASVSLCPNTIGQAVTAIMCDPLKPEDPSYESFTGQMKQLHDDLKYKAILTFEHMNGLQGLSCQPVNGALYAFPRIEIPEKALERAQELNIAPDMLYCQELLEYAGIICVPGSGFGQFPDTYHFRLTLLPEVKTYKKILQKIRAFHEYFNEKFSNNDAGKFRNGRSTRA